MQYKKEENFSEWFNELITENQLVDDRYNIKGFLIYKEWCAKSLKKMYSIYENVLDNKGHEPLFMPVLIPEENFYKESEHVEGFTPEVFWVTSHGKDEQLDQKLALRPTSETAFYQMYNLWIRSYQDLPFKRYQSGSVYRFETKATRPFFRGREFYWIETHCAFRDEKSARDNVKDDMNTTHEVLLEKFGIPFMFFRRPEWDKFAGAVDTYGADALMPSGKLLQIGSTHYLGTNFSKPFNVKYKNEKGEEEFAHLTCYGPGMTRIYGGLISLHSDNKGLRLPFELAPKQIVIVPIIFANKDNSQVLAKSKSIYTKLAKSYDVIYDDAISKTPGEKFYGWEMKGIPIRIEIGPKDLENHKLTIFRRDLNTKIQIDENDLTKTIKEIEQEFTLNLKNQALALFKDNVKDAKNIDEIKKIIGDGKIARINFIDRTKDAEKYADIIKEKTGAEVRGTRLDVNEKATGNCAISGKPAKVIVYVGKSY